MANIIQLMTANNMADWKDISKKIEFKKVIVLHEPDEIIMALLQKWTNIKGLKVFSIVYYGSQRMIFFDDPERARECYEFIKDCFNFINSYALDISKADE